MSIALLASCDHHVDIVNLGIDDVYYVERMRKLPLHSAFTGSEYCWKVNGKVVSTSPDYIFMESEEGAYDVSFDIIDDASPYHFDFKVYVLHEEIEYSPYISQVYEYCPAPGQFVNEMPQYDDGDTAADMVRKAQECISGTNDIMISLGAYGGYVTFGFDHTVVNVAGEYDFRIWGNCFYEAVNPDARGGSAEPGIVMVSYDSNCNGVPDDDWYELAGSDYYANTTLHNYTITYHRPDADKSPIPDDTGFISDTHYIAWHDSQGSDGYVAKNIFHKQSYWPRWMDDSPSLSFNGSCLPQNGFDTSGYGSYYVLYSFDWGYVDNHPNDYADLNSFDISNAVDANGYPVNLPGADFIRVYTGVNQYCGWLGETSTELSRAQDLHIQLPGIPDI